MELPPGIPEGMILLRVMGLAGCRCQVAVDPGWTGERVRQEIEARSDGTVAAIGRRLVPCVTATSHTEGAWGSALTYAASHREGVGEQRRERGEEGEQREGPHLL